MCSWSESCWHFSWYWSKIHNEKYKPYSDVYDCSQWTYVGLYNITVNHVVPILCNNSMASQGSSGNINLHGFHPYNLRTRTHAREIFNIYITRLLPTCTSTLAQLFHRAPHRKYAITALKSSRALSRWHFRLGAECIQTIKREQTSRFPDFREIENPNDRTANIRCVHSTNPFKFDDLNSRDLLLTFRNSFH